MSYLGWFDGELRPDAWFDAELQKAGWFDTELINTVSGGAYTLTADAGSYALTGVAASIIKGYALNAEAGSFTLTGQDATITKSHVLDCEAGSFTVTGNEAEFVYSGEEIAPTTANQWYGFLTAYELLNKKKKRQVFDAEAEVEELLVEIPKAAPKADDLEAQKLLRAVKRKAERDGKAAADAFVAKLIAQSQARMLAEMQANEAQRQLEIEAERIRLFRLQDEEEAILLLL